MPPSIQGEVPEWSNGTDSKSVVGVTLPGVRIPPSPPFYWKSVIYRVVLISIVAHSILICLEIEVSLLRNEITTINHK